MKTKDYSVAHIAPEELADLKAISDVSLLDLINDENGAVLIFPESLQEYSSDLGSKEICRIKDGDKTLVTNSIIGFVGRNNTTLTINSRFSAGERDYFLHYMIQKIAGINLFDLNHTTSDDYVLDFLIYLFPLFLKRAVTQGIFKQYITHNYNDSNVSGAINISRHIQSNIPFNGKVAYSKREYTGDNNVTQLIRHTIEFIKDTPLAARILSSGNEIRDFVRKIESATPSYEKQKRNKVINNNIRPIAHPFYSEYTSLQRLCIRILRHEEISYGSNPNKIYGILFDATWLWEEYLAGVLSSKFIHCKKDSGPRFNLFENFQQIIPDYLSRDKRVVADAKYIPLNAQQSYFNEEKATAIYYKTITYMYRFCSKKGYLLYPHPDTESSPKCLKIKTEKEGINGGEIIKLGLRIPSPSRCHSFMEFVDLMHLYEEQFLSEFSKL